VRVVTFKADEELLRQLDEIARESKVPRSVVIRKLLAPRDSLIQPHEKR